MKKMDKKIKAKWIKALRSGRYRQRVGRLIGPSYDAHTRKPHHCCLGVLCRVLRLKVVTKGAGSGFFAESGFLSKGGGAWLTMDLNKEVKNRCKLSDAAIGRLVVMNDEKLSSFKEIAKFIEKHL